MKNHMNFEVLTLFPGLIEQVTSESIVGRAICAGLISVTAHDIRSYSEDKHNRVDDTPYGGGMGMLMAAPPVFRCIEAAKAGLTGSVRCVYMSPAGKVLDQKKARSLLEYDNLVILCGHYEGIDSRVIDRAIDEEISIGDYVLTGGELPACVLIDVLSRMVDGVLASSECYENESIASGALEYPQYTRPYDFMGDRVPDVLLSGNHREIEKWRTQRALELTLEKRPDLL